MAPARALQQDRAALGRTGRAQRAEAGEVGEADRVVVEVDQEGLPRRAAARPEARQMIREPPVAQHRREGQHEAEGRRRARGRSPAR